MTKLIDNRIETQTTFTRHRGPVTSVAGVPGTNTAVSSGYDSAVGFIDLDARRIDLLGYHEHLVNRVRVSPDGRWAATPSSDYTVGIWNLRDRRLECLLRGHSDDVEDFAFIDRRTGVSVSRDTRILVWDLSTGAITRIIEGHERDVLSISYDRGRIFTSGDDMTLKVWELATGSLLRSWGPFENETDTCAIDPLYGRAILGCDDGMIRVFDTCSGALVAEIAAHTSGIKIVAVSPTTGDILSAAYDQRILVWDAATFSCRLELDQRWMAWERSFNWTPDGARILAGTFDGTALVWDAVTGGCIDEVGVAGDGNACFNDVSGTADGRVATVSDDGFVRVGVLLPLEQAWLSKVQPLGVRMLSNAVCVSDASGVLVTGAHSHRLHIFDWNDLTRPDVEIVLDEGPVNCLRVLQQPRGLRIFAACYSGAVVSIAIDGSDVRKWRVHEGAVKALRLHPTQPFGVSCSAAGEVVSWDFEGRVLERFNGHMAIVDDVDIDPTGTLLCSVSRDFSLKVYRLSDGKIVHTVPLGRKSPKGVLFWDPHTVVVTNYWGALLRIDLRTETKLTRQVAENGISAATRCGEHLAAASYDGSVYLVRPDDLAVIGRLQAMQQRLAPATLP